MGSAMGTRGKNAVVAALAAGCTLLLMGVVRIDSSTRGEPAVPQEGWRSDDAARQPIVLPETTDRTR